MKRRTLRDLAIVGAGFALVAVVSAAWLAVDRRPPEWDHANHLERAVLCAADLARGDVGAALARSSFYPPLVLCAAGIASRVVPSDVGAPGAVVLAFLLIGMVSTWRIGRRLGGSEAGVVAAVVFGTAPFVVWQSLRFQLDVPLAAMVALTVDLLLAAEGFSRPGVSLAAGAGFGLGLLTKPPFVVYVLPALAWALARASSARALAGAAAFAALAAAVALPWYGPRLLGMAAQVGARSFRQAAESGLPDPFSAAGLSYYPLQFPVQIGAVGVVLFAAGLVACVRRRAWFPLAALAPFVVFLLIQNKNLRYTLPLVPAAAVVAGMGFASLGRRGRAVAGAAVLVAAVVQTTTAAFGVPPASRLQVAGIPLALESPPLTDDWPHRRLLDAIVRDSGGSPARVSVVPNHVHFSAANFRYYAVRDGLPLAIARAWDGEPIGVDYMILKSGDVGPPWTAERIRRIETRLARDPHLARAFPVLEAITLPDGSRAEVRVRRIGAGVDAPPERLARAVEEGFRRAVAGFARDVRGLDVHLDHDAAILRGSVRRARIAAAEATVGDLARPGRPTIRIRDLAITVDDVLVNPYSALAETRVDLLDVGRLRLESAAVSAGDFRDYLAGQKGFRDAVVALEPGALSLELRRRGPDISARVRLVRAAGRPFALVAERVRVGGVPVPGILVDWVVRNFDPSPGLAARVPFALEAGDVSIGRDGLRVGGP